MTRWLLEPDSRRVDGQPFDLADLVVLTAMTGDEYARTGDVMTKHLLPMFRQHGVRYVQVARAGQASDAGYVVLDDSTAPTRMHMAGPWRLHDELAGSGTVPQIVSGSRRCSYRAKGQVLDGWIGDHIRRDFVHVIGFAAEEGRRAERDQSYTAGGRQPRYPLMEWGWDRARCRAYLHAVHGVDWPRSCCGYCPFQAGPEVDLMVDRWRADPAAAVAALNLEWTALALNPRSALFGSRTARQVAEQHDLHHLIAAAAERRDAGPWAVYDVRRLYLAKRNKDTRAPDPAAKGIGWRSVRTVAAGPKADMVAQVAALPGAAWDRDVVRAWTHTAGPPYPAAERFTVAAPAGVVDKERPGFAGMWSTVVDQPALDLAALR